MLTGGKPERVPSSQIDWVKAPWSSGLHVWEADEPKESRVARFIESFDTPESPVPTFPDPSVPARALALCAGYGGLERGVNLANEQTETVCYVERQAYAASVLVERMRQGDLVQAPIWDELDTFDAKRWRGNVDIVIAGIPCQGASVAGKRKGVEDARWLWPLVWKITQDVGASWLFVENVPGLLSVNGGGAFAEVLRDLGARVGLPVGLCFRSQRGRAAPPRAALPPCCQPRPRPSTAAPRTGSTVWEASSNVRAREHRP